MVIIMLQTVTVTPSDIQNINIMIEPLFKEALNKARRRQSSMDWPPASYVKYGKHALILCLSYIAC